MKKKLIFATNNLHKLNEVSQMLGNSFDLLSLKDINCYSDIPETANTLEGNALMKARFIYQRYHLNCFADDTGLEVEALNGAPGVFSARYAGETHDSKANMDKLLAEMKGFENRNAQFRTVIALIINEKEYLFEGLIKGMIIEKEKGSSGFGYDPVFIPEGFNETFAELGNEIKNKISHRAQAIDKLCKFIQNAQ